MEPIREYTMQEMASWAAYPTLLIPLLAFVVLLFIVKKL